MIQEQSDMRRSQDDVPIAVAERVDDYNDDNNTGNNGNNKKDQTKNNNNGNKDQKIKSIRNKRIVEAFWVITTVGIAIVNLASDWNMCVEIGSQLDTAKSLSKGDTWPNASTIENLNEEFKETNANTSVFSSDLCDVDWISKHGQTKEEQDEGDAEGPGGLPQLISQLSALHKSCQAMFFLSIVPVAGYLLFKIGMLLDVGKNEGKTADKFHPVMATDTSPFKNRSNAKEKERRRAQRERFALRQETVLYLLVQVIEDVSQLLIITLFVLFVFGVRGLNCVVCFAEEEKICSVEDNAVMDNSAASFSLGMTCLSLFWNGAQLAQRWVLYAKLREPPFTSGKLFFITTSSFLVYVAAIATPLMVLVYVYIGPEYLLLEGSQLTPFLGISIIGGVFWFFGLCAFCTVFGIEAGETCCAEGVVCCEMCECCEVCDLCLGGCCCC